MPTHTLPTRDELAERLTPIVQAAKSPDRHTSLTVGDVAVLLGLDPAECFRGADAAAEQAAAQLAEKDAELAELRERLAAAEAAAGGGEDADPGEAYDAFYADEEPVPHEPAEESEPADEAPAASRAKAEGEAAGPPSEA